MPTKKLPRHLYLNDARKHKGAFFLSLSTEEVTILDTVARGGSCFGSMMKGDKSVLSRRRGSHEDSAVLETEAVRELVRMGWLRFAPTVKTCGWFWMTDACERLWDVLDRFRDVMGGR